MVAIAFKADLPGRAMDVGGCVYLVGRPQVDSSGTRVPFGLAPRPPRQQADDDRRATDRLTRSAGRQRSRASSFLAGARQQTACSSAEEMWLNVTGTLLPPMLLKVHPPPAIEVPLLARGSDCINRPLLGCTQGLMARRTLPR